MFLFYIHEMEMVFDWFNLRVFCLDDAGHKIVLGEESVVPVGSILFYFISFYLALFLLVILLYTNIYSCILFMLVDGRVISQLNRGSLDHPSFTWQQQAAEAAETCWVNGKR